MVRFNCLVFSLFTVALYSGREFAPLKFQFHSAPPYMSRLRSLTVSFEEHSLTDLNLIEHCFDKENTGNNNLIPYLVNVLNFSNNDITDISGLFGMFCTTIHTINLERNRLEKITVEDLHSLKRAFPNLRLLKLNTNPILIVHCRDLLKFSQKRIRPLLFKVEISGKTIHLDTVLTVFFGGYSEWQDSESDSYESEIEVDDDDEGAFSLSDD
jgi:hypothetical protein